MDRYPILLIKVNSCDGLWALKVRPVDDMRDICLILDTARTGVFECDIQRATGWRGRRDFKIIIFAVGEGRKLEVEWIRLMSKD